MSSIAEEQSRRSLYGRLFSHPSFILFAIASGIALRLLVALWFPVDPLSDGAWYLQRARELAEGMGYQEGGYPTAYWPVGYPGILAGFVLLLGPGKLSYITLNLIAALVTMWLIVWLARRLTGNESVARLAVVAYALYPNHLVQSGIPLSEGVYTALYLSAFALLISSNNRWGKVFGSGLIFGIATLVKSQTVLFPFGAVIALWWIYRPFRWRQMVVSLLVIYAGLMVIVLPWSARNFSTFGQFVLVSTNGGVALLIGANDYATGDHLAIEESPLMERIAIPWERRVELQVELSAEFKQLAVHWIKDNPGQYIAWMPRKILSLWKKDTDGFWSFSEKYPHLSTSIRLAQWVNQIFYVVVLLLAILCAIRAARALLLFDEEGAKLGLLFCMPLFVTLLAAVFTGQIRYHSPAMPTIIIAASWSLWVVIFERRATKVG